MADKQPREPVANARGLTAVEIEPKTSEVQEGPTHGKVYDQPLSGTEAPPEKEVVAALRRFIRSESGQPATPPPANIGMRQAIVLLLFSIDIGLAYAQIQSTLQNPLSQAILKVIPWIIGGTALGYAARLRKFLTEQAKHLSWAAAALVVAVPLFLINMPVFSLKLHVPSSDVSVAADNRVRKDPLGEGVWYRLVFPSLDEYYITISNPLDSKTGRAEGWEPFTVKLSRLEVLWRTLLQIPLADRIFGPPELNLSVLYVVPAESSSEASIEVEGQFEYGFFQQQSGCRPSHAKNKSLQAAQCRVGEGVEFFLPPGSFDFTLERPCRKTLPAYTVGKSALINIDELCSAK